MKHAQLQQARIVIWNLLGEQEIIWFCVVLCCLLNEIYWGASGRVMFKLCFQDECTSLRLSMPFGLIKQLTVVGLSVMFPSMFHPRNLCAFCKGNLCFVVG